MAVVTIIWGAWWAGQDFKQQVVDAPGAAAASPRDGDRSALGAHVRPAAGRRICAHGRSPPSAQSHVATSAAASANEGTAAPEHASLQSHEPAEVLTVTLPHVAGFVTFATAFMFLMFFVLNRLVVYAFVLFFAYGGFVATLAVARTSLHAAAPPLARTTRRVTLFGARLDVSAADAGAMIIAAAVVLLWLLYRHSAWSWVLQDVLGVALIATVLRAVALPDGRVATALLLSLFVYDIFMVFITPLFMPHGASVMVSVATGGPTREVLPMLLLFPRVLPPRSGAMMLGFGDVVVPGLLVTLLRRFDLAAGRGCLRGYTGPAVVAYAAGLAATDTALALQLGGSQGQPALLYLVPATLGVTWALAAARRDARSLWLGVPDEWKDHESGTDDDGDGDEGGVAEAARLLAPAAAAMRPEAAQPDDRAEFDREYVRLGSLG